MFYPDKKFKHEEWHFLYKAGINLHPPQYSSPCWLRGNPRQHVSSTFSPCFRGLPVQTQLVCPLRQDSGFLPKANICCHREKGSMGVWSELWSLQGQLSSNQNWDLNCIFLIKRILHTYNVPNPYEFCFFWPLFYIQ